MATSIIKNNFTGGILSNKLYGQYSTSAYDNGCMALQNMRIWPQGGVSRRGGTLLMNSPNMSDSEAKISLRGTRLIPFIINETTSFLVELGHQTLRIWKDNCTALIEINTGGQSYYKNVTNQQFANLYTSIEIDDVNYAQCLDGSNILLVLVHKEHSPVIIKYDYSISDIPGTSTPISIHSLVASTGSGSYKVKLQYYEVSSKVITPATGKVYYTRTGTGEIEDPFVYTQTNTVSNPWDPDEAHYLEDPDNLGMLTTSGYYPSVVFYYAGRLWFAASTKHPYRMWASKPFEVFNFEFEDIVSTVNENQTAQDIINAIKDPETYDIDDVETTMVDEWVVQEDSALMLEVGTSQNNQIRFISALSSNLIVGTSSGEWIMPGDINGLTQSTTQISFYGSAKVQPCMAGNDVIFVQIGGQKPRAYMYGEGYASIDLSYISGTFGQITHMAWQQVPEPTLYIVAGGKLCVCFYDRNYSLKGWSIWNFDSLRKDGTSSTAIVKDVAILPVIGGQRAYVSLVRTEGNTTRNNLEAIRNVEVSDTSIFKDIVDTYAQDQEGNPGEYSSYLITNTYENNSSGSSIGKKKRIYKATLRCVNTTEINVGYRYTTNIQTPDMKYMEDKACDQSGLGIDDIEISVPGGYEKFIAFSVYAKSSKPLNLEAISLLTEVE